MVLSDTSCSALTFYPDAFQVPMGSEVLAMGREFIENGGGLDDVWRMDAFPGLSNYGQPSWEFD